MNIELFVTNVTEYNKQEKLVKAARTLAKQLGIQVRKAGFTESEHPRSEDGRFTNGGTKEAWDSSTEKAKELRAEDWGTPEEIVEMAKPIRTAKNRREAEEALETIISHNGEYKRSSILLESRSGLSACLRRSSIGKLVSTVQSKAMPVEALYLAVANIDKLFTNAIEPWKFELNPNKNNDDLKERRILYAPMQYGERIIPIKITVKEYQNPNADNKMYSVEAINFDIQPIKKGAVGTINGLTLNKHPLRPSKPLQKVTLDTPNFVILHLFDSVNEYIRKSAYPPPVPRLEKTKTHKPQIWVTSIEPYPDMELSIRNITKENRKDKFTKAIRAIAKAINVPVEIAHGAESFLYPVKQELSDYWTGYYAGLLKQIYKTVITALDLPPVTVQKAMSSGEDILRYRGKVIYNPETGQPLKQKDFDALIEAIQKFLTRKTKDTAKQLVLDSVAIEKLLRHIATYQSSKTMEQLKLSDLSYQGKTFDWIREDMKHIQEAFILDGYAMSRSEIARYQVAQDHVAHLVTRVDDEIKNEIKDVILNGIVEKRSKSQVSQDLFNSLGSKNKDWKRIADTEMVNTSNLAGIMEIVNRAPAGKKVYLERYELAQCCEKCEAIDGKVVLWSDVPLSSDKIDDEFTDTAIWEGKPYEKGKTTLVTGCIHPNCRGGWIPWGGKDMDAMIAKIQKKADAWDKAVEQAQEEYKAKGIENPTDQTSGYTDRINELYDILKK